MQHYKLFHLGLLLRCLESKTWKRGGERYLTSTPRVAVESRRP
jgi:hypothetical protein